MSVITWTVAGGSVVFLLGLISAIGSRRQRKDKRVTEILLRQSVKNPSLRPREDAPMPSAMSMAAASGVQNGIKVRTEGAELATVGNTTS